VVVLALADWHLIPQQKASDMHNGATPNTLRRSSRVPTSLQVLVTSLDGAHFSEVCETTVVSAHGCAMLSRVKVETGIPLHLHSKDGRETTARVVSCQVVGPDHRYWRVGAKLDQPDNFWGLKEIPHDWFVQSPVMKPKAPHLLQPSTPSLRALPEQKPSAEAQIRKIINDALRPLQAEISTLKEKLAKRDANPSSFEVSLSSIPPELEKQIESRLRQDLNPKLLDEASKQAALLLASAKKALDQRTGESYDVFVKRVTDELKVIEKHAEEISGRISASAQDHLSRGLEEFHQQLLEGGNSLKRLGEQLLDFLQQNLHNEYAVRRGDLEQLRLCIAEESTRMQQQVDSLNARIAKLAESAAALESGLDQRLSRMSSATIKETRAQFESMTVDVLEELTKRSVTALTRQLDEVTATMNARQDSHLTAFSESLNVHKTSSVQAFERSMEQLARDGVERWRQKFESGLNALVKNLNEQFRAESSATPE
jgi:hypothetical protein